MKELTLIEIDKVSGGVSANVFDSMGGAIIGAVAGGMSVAWDAWNISARTDGMTSGILAPVQGVLGGLFGSIWGVVFGGVIGAAEGVTDSLARANSVWDVLINAGA